MKRGPGMSASPPIADMLRDDINVCKVTMCRSGGCGGPKIDVQDDEIIIILCHLNHSRNASSMLNV